MNMMQILLQKISRRSKVIRKQEKVVNENLKRKRIYLERERFDLMSVLRKSLEVTEEREQAAAAQAGAHLAQKNKTQKAAGSDLTSRCLSTSGTKYGTDQPNTQSIRGSTAAPVYGEENTSMDGCGQKTRMLSGADVSRHFYTNLAHIPAWRSFACDVTFEDAITPVSNTTYFREIHSIYIHGPGFILVKILKDLRNP